ncbi:DUF3035 domain-containing protein [Stagnihabitans tardus]|uniref:DUF3035 domain-containing protein n=1 Tax=Stagnihabitans tardus TaxID=2699202 RepID=A0AAE5BXQ9_9RHOB|nr:DUF3035 domain-containing protein [Stagnihabitans tardus]NBZ89613.1 DUF3035 domain-containing protein [Stagnihabitans tardus]
MRKAGLVLAGVLVMTLASCGSRDRVPNLMNLRSGTNGPDEFSILPPKGLEMPEDLAALPEPTPGGTNLTDQNPQADAILALGGKPGAGVNDNALVAYAGRHGMDPNIRASLAAEDLEFRKKHPGKLLERLFNLTTYFNAYRDSWLDQYKELARWRAAGVATPAAPPPASSTVAPRVTTGGTNSEDKFLQ